MNQSLLEATEKLCGRLQAGGVENARSEARWMAQIAPKKYPERPLQEILDEWLHRRIAGEPFQYIVGSAEFYGIELEVGPGVLIPRPETEILVDHALEFLRSCSSPQRVLDLCTGSGAIPLVLAVEAPTHSYTGIDISEEALTWARRNLRRLSIDNCVFMQGDLFAPVPAERQFSLITANPPYIADEEFSTIPAEVKDYEPMIALRADNHGLAIAMRILNDAHRYLRPGGQLLMEIGETQGEAIQAALADAGFIRCAILPDLTGRTRIASGVMTC